jgi:8-oxo-dGTP diphosphatase
MKNIEVVAAIIIHDRKILCVQRGYNKLDYISKKFEFPGGKMESGETQTAAIVREIWEELRMEIVPIREFLIVEHQYPDFFITMHSLICTCCDPTLTLTEHLSFKWLSLVELNKLDWAEADKPIVNELINRNL